MPVPASFVCFVVKSFWNSLRLSGYRVDSNRLNVLFVNYGDFTTNSLNHIGAFAGRLTLLGHACVVAVPEKLETISAIPGPLFTPVTFARGLDPEPIFPDRRAADVVHAWTPRENVRDFTLRYLHANPAATLLIHLEDNESFLLESFAHEPVEKLRQLSDEELAARLSPRLSHPVRFRNFLRLAHGATYITDRLREFVPAATPSFRLLPGIDAAQHGALAPSAALREQLGAAPGEKIIVYTGSTNFATLADIRSLVLAVRLINDRGTPCRLVRTGIHPPELLQEISAIGGDRVIDLGFVEKTRLRDLLALADVLVQPGAPGDFNDYRLPSKVPEFLAAGRPVILPRANIAREMEDGRHALLLDTSTPDEIAAACLRVFADPALARRLAAGALEFSRAHFDLAANTAGLLAFYEHLRSFAAPIFTDPATPPSEDVLLAQGDLALRMRAKEQSIAHRDAELAALRTELATLHAELATLRGEKTVLVARANYQHAKLQQARNEAEVLRGELSRARAALDRVAHELASVKASAAAERARAEAAAATAAAKATAGAAEAAAAAAAEIAWRDARIARMQASASWRITSPLRALRRLLIDPFTKSPAAAPPSPSPASAQPPSPPPPASEAIPPEPSIDSSWSYSIDEPANWDSIPAAGQIRGWFLAAESAPVTRIRLRAGDQTFIAETGLVRSDVAVVHPDHPHARTSGFSIDYSLPPYTTQPLEFEVSIAGASWRSFAALTARIGAPPVESPRRDYAAWVGQFDTLSPHDEVAIRTRAEALPPLRQPRISILMPTFNTDPRWLARAIGSVRAQLYPHWELCIADDASTAPHVRLLLEDFARRDERIKITFRDENGHISAASNSALALATGEFTALLDHDDELPPHALAEVAFALADDPALEFIYSDEDKIDELGHRFDPYFKPDWNPDLLLGQNYTCHLSVFRTARLRAIGGFRVGYEGSQDWDLTLRATESLAPARIRHIPRVLYHWRAIPGSTALVIDQKSNYPFLAAKKALADHLARTGVAAGLESIAGLHWRVRRALPSPAPKVSIIILTKNAEGLLRLCLGSIFAKTTYPDYEIIVVNNGSDAPGALAYFDELRAQFGRPQPAERAAAPEPRTQNPEPKTQNPKPQTPNQPHVRILDHDAPFNFSALNNLAAREARGSILAFLNNDLEVITPGWLDEMVSHAIRPEIGCVGAMLYYPDDTIQHAGAILGLTGPAGKDGVAGHAFKGFPRGHEGQRNRLKLVQNYSAVTAACLVIRRELFEAVGGFNERELAVAFNDIDLCLRVRATGCRNLWTPFAEFYHRESATRGPEDTAEKQQRFQSEIACMRERWAPLLDHDPAYNPNLTLQREDFSLAFPPR
jgi:GT2 family glycosyltransferase/glycosyltransferase involved in cell wall biosynthesis